jgi:hypothetical protein
MGSTAPGISGQASRSNHLMSKNASAGIWEIRDVHTGERISKFRARKQADVTRYLEMARLGLKRPIEDFEAVFITEWE